MTKKFNRVLLLILDGVGAGELPDADIFGDVGSNTLLHIHEKAGLKVPNLSSLGLSNIIPLETSFQKGGWGKMAEKSKGKDTTTGHWELGGIVVEDAFPTYPNGFPKKILDPFCEQIGRGILGNYAASGTVIIQELGDEHVATGKPIVYTSADSVFQIAAHEEIIPVPQLYKFCEIARKILTGKHSVSRVIARPFVGENGNYTRTKARHDYSLKPFDLTILDYLQQAGYDSIGVGKIEDIFASQGITKSYPVKGNKDCLQVTLDLLKKKSNGLIFTNLVDFDMLYGHRNNPDGFRDELEWFDENLPHIYRNMTSNDLLIITADHGNDPTTPSTDHAREYVPLLVYHHDINKIELGTRESFSDVAKTIDEIFNLNKIKNGTSFLSML